MVTLFQKAVAEYNPSDELEPYYTKIMVGVAPGGVVSVWVNGARTREVFFGQAKRVDIDPSEAFDFPFSSKEESDTYMRLGLEEEVTSAQLKKIGEQGIPFDLWARYRKQYAWTMLPTKTNQRLISFIHLQGNSVDVDDYGDLEVAGGFDFIPEYISFAVGRDVYEVNFDDIEILEAFEQLASHVELSEPDRVIRLEFDLKEDQTTSTVRLFNAAQSITLKKAVFTE